MSKNKSDILKRINEINSKKIKPIYIPSLEREVGFKPLIIKHQKSILESSVDNMLFNSEFKVQSYNIIKELATEDVIHLINVIDRDVILFQLRYHSIGNTFNGFNLDEKFNSIKEYKFFELKPYEYENDDIVIPVSIPTLEYEYSFIKDFNKNNKIGNLNVNDLPALREQTGLLFFSEIYKYIQKIIFKSDDFILDMKSNDLTLKDKFEIVYNLDKDILINVRDKIKEFKEPITEFLKIDEDSYIEIDPEFFNDA